MSKQNIHIAMGSLAYAVAKADGEIQIEEKKLIKKLAQQEFEIGDSDIEWIDNMFVKLEKEGITLEDSYRYALDVLEANRYEFDFDNEMKNRCLKFLQKIADVFNNTSSPEQQILNRFIKDTISF